MVIKKNSRTVWGPEQQEVFDQIRNYLGSAPILTVLKEGEELYYYLFLSDAAVTAALMVEGDGVQQPVYFCSKI